MFSNAEALLPTIFLVFGFDVLEMFEAVSAPVLEDVDLGCCRFLPVFACFLGSVAEPAPLTWEDEGGEVEGEGKGKEME